MSSKQSSLLLFAVTAICAVLFAAALRPATTSATAAGLSAQSHTGGSALDHYVEQASEFSSRARANGVFPEPAGNFQRRANPFSRSEVFEPRANP